MLSSNAKALLPLFSVEFFCFTGVQAHESKLYSIQRWFSEWTREEICD